MDTKSDQEEGLARQMRVLRRVMNKDWVVLRALALRDQHPELDVETLIDMAREQAAAEGRPLSRE